MVHTKYWWGYVWGDPVYGSICSLYCDIFPVRMVSDMVYQRMFGVCLGYVWDISDDVWGYGMTIRTAVFGLILRTVRQ